MGRDADLRLCFSINNSQGQNLLPTLPAMQLVNNSLVGECSPKLEASSIVQISIHTAPPRDTEDCLPLTLTELCWRLRQVRVFTAVPLTSTQVKHVVS